MADFRSERMPSPDGLGVAKGRWQRAWDAYSNAVRAASPSVLEPVVKPMAREVTFDMVGFYFAWHMHGGFEGLREAMGMSRSAMYRRVALFRRVFHEHPDVYRMPGMGLDVAAYLAGVPYGQGPVPTAAEDDPGTT